MIQRFKNVKTILTISVILNLFCLGIASGTVVHKMKQSAPKRFSQKELSPESRSIVARSVQRARRDMQPANKQARNAQRKVKEAITAKDFNAEVFDQAIKEFHDSQWVLLEHKTNVVKELADKISYEERVKLGNRFLHKLSRGGQKSHQKRGKDRGHERDTLRGEGAGKRDAQSQDRPARNRDID